MLAILKLTFIYCLTLPLSMSEVSEDDFENISQFYSILCDLIPLGNWRTTLHMINSREMAHYNSDSVATDKGSLVKDSTSQTADIILNVDNPMIDQNGDRWEHTLIHKVLNLATDDLCEYIEHRNPSLKNDELYKTKLERTLLMLAYGYYNALAVGMMASDKTQSGDGTYTNEIDPLTKHNCEVT